MDESWVSEALAADIAPGRREFPAELRAELDARWDDRGDDGAPAAPVVRIEDRRRRRLALGLAGVLTAAAATVGVLAVTQRSGGDRVIVTPGEEAPTSPPVAANGISTDGRWVVVEAPGPMLPQFPAWVEFDANGDTRGFDGCNTFTQSSAGYEADIGDCEFMGLDLSATDDWVNRLSSAVPDNQLTSGGFTIEQLSDQPAGFAAIVGRWQVAGTSQELTFASNGDLLLGTCEVPGEPWQTIGQWQPSATSAALSVTLTNQDCVDPVMNDMLFRSGLTFSLSSDRAWLWNATNTMLRLDRMPVATVGMPFGPASAQVLANPTVLASIPPGWDVDPSRLPSVVMTPSGRLFRSIPSASGYTVDVLIDGSWETTDITGLANPVVASADERLYSIAANGDLLLYWVSDAHIEAAESLPTGGKCELVVTAAETRCGDAVVRVQRVASDAQVAGLTWDDDSTAVVSSGPEFRRTHFTFENTITRVCESRASGICSSEVSFNTGGEVMWAPAVSFTRELTTSRPIAVLLSPAMDARLIQVADLADATIVGVSNGIAYAFGRVPAEGVNPGAWELDAYPLYGPPTAALDLETLAGVGPAEGGEELGRWTAAQIVALGGHAPGQGTAVGLSDGTLAVLSTDGTQILIVSATGDLRERVDLGPTSNSYMMPVGNDVVRIFPDDTPNADTTARYVSLGPATRGLAVPDPASGITISGGSCADGIDRGGQHWPLEPRTACHEDTQPTAFGLPDGSVLLHRLSYVASRFDPSETEVERSAMRLDLDGFSSEVLLGRHAFDGSEGWVSLQATATGGISMFTFRSGDTVLYRYTYGPPTATPGG